MKQKHPESTSKESRNTQQEFEIPGPTEKQAHKQILDTLREKLLVEPPPPHTSQTSGYAEGTHDGGLRLPPGKNYFRVREVAALVGVGAHVLRFWETEFSMVRPTKSRSGQRVYRRKDVEILGRIRHLLHDEKLSIKAARESLLRERREKASAPAAVSAPKRDEKHHSAVGPTERALDLKEIMVDLRQLMKLCRQDPFTFTHPQ